MEILTSKIQFSQEVLFGSLKCGYNCIKGTHIPVSTGVGAGPKKCLAK